MLEFYKKQSKVYQMALKKAVEKIKQEVPALEDFNLESYYYALALIEHDFHEKEAGADGEGNS